MALSQVISKLAAQKLAHKKKKPAGKVRFAAMEKAENEPPGTRDKEKGETMPPAFLRRKGR